MGDGAAQNIGDDLHVAMGMRRKSRPALDPVFIDDPQRAKTFIGRVVIIAERKAVPGLQPIDLGFAAIFGTPHRNHANVKIPKIASSLYQASSESWNLRTLAIIDSSVIRCRRSP